ncbi:MAG: DNA recombination protein RmuC [Spirochaetales bacterium]|nr:MAG: DNA recombination protein RmuC [Spirochaetales bacterium]
MLPIIPDLSVGTTKMISDRQPGDGARPRRDIDIDRGGNYARGMTPAVLAAIVAAAVALLIGLLAGLLISRGRIKDPDVPGMLQQIDHVRSELRQLTQLFLVPRTRGAVGETLLAELLASWLPRKSFDLQFGFRNGTRVDAVIRLGNRLVPVDSKFPMEAVQRFLSSPEGSRASEDLAGSGQPAPLPAEVRRTFQKHIADIADRYIVPDEGTLGFALMYIPSEGIYYQIFVERPDELMATALRQNVVPVSPGTLFLYLQTVAYGLRGLALPEGTQRLVDDLTRLRTDVVAFSRSYQLAGTHLRNLNKAYEDAGSKLGRIEVHTDRLVDRDTTQ